MNHVIVQRAHPLQNFAIRVLFLGLFVALLWAAYELGYMQSEEDIIAAKGGRQSLLIQQRILKTNNDQLSKEIIHLERNYLLEKEASHLVQLDINKQKKTIEDLNAQLTFYKGIVTTNKSRESLYIQSLQIKPYRLKNAVSKNNLAKSQKSDQQDQAVKTGKLYQYSIILAQKIKRKRYSSGMLKVVLLANDSEKSIKLPISELLLESPDSKKDPFKFRFKYFQEFKGIIRIPESMTVSGIEVIAITKKKKLSLDVGQLTWSKDQGVEYVGR